MRHKEIDIEYNKLIDKVNNSTNKDNLTEDKETLDEIKYYNSLSLEFNDLEKGLSKALQYKEQELDNNIRDLKRKQDLLAGFDQDLLNIKTMCFSIDNLRKDALAKMDDLESELDKSKTSFNLAVTALMMLGGYAVLKKHKSLLGTLISTYLISKVLEGVLKPNKNSIISTYNDYLDSLTNYLDDLDNALLGLNNNLDKINDLEEEIKEKYKAYLEEREFVNFFQMLNVVKDNIKQQVIEIDASKNTLEDDLNNSKVKVKTMEEG